MASAISANKAELLAIANSVASEKMIDKAIVIEAMEEAIQKSARNRYGAENDIRAKLDPLTGDLRLWRVVEVVEEVEDYFKQVDLTPKGGAPELPPLPDVELMWERRRRTEPGRGWMGYTIVAVAGGLAVWAAIMQGWIN